MKKLIIPITLGVAMTFAACGGEEEAEEEGAENTEKKEEVKEPVVVTMNIDTEESYIWWRAEKENSDDFHEGKLKISEGSVTATDGAVTDGTVKIDVASIYETDLSESPEYEQKLAAHLSGNTPHFFAQDSLGMPTLSIKGYEEGMLNADLTIRGTTNAISIPVNVEIKDGKLMATSDKFMVDLSQYGMTGFDEPAEGEERGFVIKDAVEFKVNVVAK